MPKFKDKVIEIITLIPHGKVVSYGQVALMAGVPRAARQVGETLRKLEEDILEGKYEIPWWRVVNNAGRITIKGTKYSSPALQKELLEKEGVKVNKDFTFKIEDYRFRPSQKLMKKLKLNSRIIDELLEKGFI